MTSNSKVKEATISGIITRRDGTQEHLGVISYYHRNPLKRLWWLIKKNVKDNLK